VDELVRLVHEVLPGETGDHVPPRSYC
jgi:hypothetical protein